MKKIISFIIIILSLVLSLTTITNAYPRNKKNLENKPKSSATKTQKNSTKFIVLPINTITQELFPPVTITKKNIQPKEFSSSIKLTEKNIKKIYNQTRFCTQSYETKYQCLQKKVQEWISHIPKSVDDFGKLVYPHPSNFYNPSSTLTSSDSPSTFNEQ